MKQTLNLKLSQQLTLTPQLKQSLRLLQLPSLDLEQEIQQTLDSNPLLERVEQEEVAAEQIQQVSRVEDNGIPQPIAEAADPSFELERTDTLAPEQDLSANLQEAFDSHRPISNQNSNHASSAHTEFTQYVVKQDSLFEHLNWQVQMTKLSKLDRTIAHTLLHCLDSDGYLSAEISDVCLMLDPKLEVEEDEVQAVLSLLKTLDPVGVGARNLGERLALLLAQLPSETVGLDLATAIVENHLELVGSRNLASLKKELEVTEEELRKSLALITSLNPRIGAQFQSDNENYVIPDVQVKKTGTVWVAQINPDNQTRLRVNRTYSDLLNSNLDQEGSAFIQQNLLEMFIKGLMSRYDTLLLVAEAIVERQQGFFEHGEQAMQPMVLQDIAEQLDMHESTISRATAGKYLLSPRGVVELKYFFSSALSTTDGTVSSSTAIRSLIKEMVAAESKAKPLSDNKIAQELEQLGHIVARRTVAKYRESMQIAPSSQRKSLV